MAARSSKRARTASSAAASTSVVTLNLSDLFNGFSMCITNVLRMKIFVAAKQVDCLKCSTKIDRLKALRHVCQDHPTELGNNSYRAIPIDRTYVCICSRPFKLSQLIDFVKHFWSCLTLVSGKSQPITTNLTKLLDQFTKSNVYATLQTATAQPAIAKNDANIFDDMPKFTAASSRHRTGAQKKSDQSVREKLLSSNAILVPELVDSLQLLYQQFALLRTTSSTSNQQNNFIRQATRLCSDYVNSLTTPLTCNLCLDSGAPPYTGGRRQLFTHYRSHTKPSAATDQLTSRSCGQCRKTFITDNDECLIQYYYHVCLCLTGQNKTPALLRLTIKLDQLCETYHVRSPTLAPPEIDSNEPYRHYSIPDALVDAQQLLDQQRDNSKQRKRLDRAIDVYNNKYFVRPGWSYKLDEAKNNALYGGHLNCKLCDRDFRAQMNGGFDPASPTYLNERPHYAAPNDRIIACPITEDIRRFFMDTPTYLSFFGTPRNWITKDAPYELFFDKPGLRSWMISLTNKVPSRKVDCFTPEDKENKYIFLHCFFFKATCIPFLQYCHNDPNISVLPNSCLCRDPSCVDAANDPDDLRNTHRHCIVVINNVDTYRRFKAFNQVHPDVADALERARLRNRTNNLRARKAYRKEITSISYYYKCINYVSRPKTTRVTLAMNNDQNSETNEADLDETDNDNVEDSDDIPIEPDGEDGAKHSDSNVHFAITQPVCYHFRPLFYVTYENGFTDWLAESQKHSLAAMLNFNNQIKHRRANGTDININFVYFGDVIQYFSRYIHQHGLGMHFEICDDRFDMIDQFKKEGRPFAFLEDAVYRDPSLFDQCADFEVVLPKRLFARYRMMMDLLQIDVKARLEMGQTIESLITIVEYLYDTLSKSCRLFLSANASVCENCGHSNAAVTRAASDLTRHM